MGTTPPNPINSGDTAWVLISAALVLLMTAPGLALFYGGMVRRKNILSVLMQCFMCLAIVSVLWVVYGYSLAFGNRVRDFRTVYRRVAMVYVKGSGYQYS
jgi:Amt family ammonium transporter